MKIRSLTLYKSSLRSLDEATMRKQLGYGIARALAGGRGNVWSAGRPSIKQVDDGYTASIAFKRTGRATKPEVEESQFIRIRELVERAVRGKGWGLNGVPAPKQETAKGPVESYHAEVKISTDPSGYFAHLYNLDAQIELVLSAVEEYQRSQFANRFHCVLYGAPACGKTEILRSLTKMLGPDAVMHFDATSTTSAGAKQLLTESAYIPPVLCIEEIEKADETSLRWLLGVMDYRAEVRVLKHRTGLVSREIKLLCLATVNDFALFNRMMDGALASRFSHKIHCPRPSREVLEKILRREIERSQGNPAWIAPALAYCIDVEGTNDPRRIVTVCLCGKNKLLTGEYQRALASAQPPKE